MSSSRLNFVFRSAEGHELVTVGENDGSLTVAGNLLPVGYVKPASSYTQAITADAAVDPVAEYVDVTGPAASTYAITLAAPNRSGKNLVIRMTSTTATNAVTWP